MKRHVFVAGAGAVALAASLTACGSSNHSSAPPTTTTTVAPSGTTTTVSGATGSGGTLANDADTLCTQVQRVRSDLAKVSLKNPTSIAALTTDFSRLQSAAGAVTTANASSGHTHQFSTVVSDVDAAVAKGKAAFAAVSKADTAALQSDFTALRTDLSRAGSAAAHTSFKGCQTTGTSGG
ncbi:hypothetical protein GHK86_05945 [Acidimicrobiaceae bacterium USS-CC1]|uniref:Lipoprotein n=1 Tax=Acidiferrimicrobium australe TaxID=2664430 RepID=A0ABW9QQZ6_9ACTN|nr:hypothetical protein [Acidiferrimicrobium australe]